MTADELVPYFVASARVAEGLRQQSPQIVFVLGCEMSLFDSGFVPGATYFERIQTMMNPACWRNRLSLPKSCCNDSTPSWARRYRLCARTSPAQ